MLFVASGQKEIKNYKELPGQAVNIIRLLQWLSGTLFNSKEPFR